MYVFGIYVILLFVVLGFIFVVLVLSFLFVFISWVFTKRVPAVFEGVIKSNLDENKTAAASMYYLGFCNLKCGIHLEFWVESDEKLKT